MGTALDERKDASGLYQLIDEPPQVRNECYSYISLFFTDQPNIFFGYCAHPSLDEQCQHYIIHCQLKVSLPSPPSYQGTVWNYCKADVQMITESINNIS